MEKKYLTKSEFSSVLKKFRDRHELNQKEAAIVLRSLKIKISDKTYQNYELGFTKPQREKMTKILNAIKSYSDPTITKIKSILPINQPKTVIKITKKIDLMNDGFLQTGKLAVLKAMGAALKIYNQPWAILNPTTSMYKSTHSILEDPTEPIDKAATIAIHDVLRRAVDSPGNPLNSGFILFNEETGLMRVPNRMDEVDENLFVFIDPIDYTIGAKRGLDGSSLITFYHRRIGVCAVVIGDLFRKRIYMRKADDRSVGLSVKFSNQPANFLEEYDNELTTDSYITLKTSKKEKLQSISLNIYTGSPQRLLLGAKYLENLLKKEKAVSEIFSIGGSLGTSRVGEGLLDASVEVAKGFRPWDFIPGAFIAHGAGASITDLNNTPISFAPGQIIKEVHIKTAFRGQALETSRQKFIVAATPELASQIANLITKE